MKQCNHVLNTVGLGIYERNWSVVSSREILGRNVSSGVERKNIQGPYFGKINK